jgi:hypothetical protein
MPNKGMKLTSVEHIGRSQLIPGVRRTDRAVGGAMSRTLVATAVLLLAAMPSSSEQPNPTITVVRVRSVHSVSVAVTVVAPPGSPVVVPYCGVDEAGTEALCGLASGLEVKEAGLWRPVQFRAGVAAVLGGAPPSSWNIREVGPGASRTFSFGWPMDAQLTVAKGDLVRVVVKSWLDLRSMKAGEPGVGVASEPFRCP